MQPWLLIFVVAAFVFGSLDGRAASIPNANFEIVLRSRRRRSRDDPLPPFPFDQYDNVCATSFPSVPAIGPPGLVLLAFALGSVVMSAGWLVHRRRALPSPDAAGF
jgi:hypothetical protein